MKTKLFVQAILVTLLLTFNPLLSANQAVTEAAVHEMQVDINTADAATIAEVLDGVGMTKATEIVAHREMYGKFHSVEQLADVTGIGDATVEKNRHRIIIVTD